MQIKSDNAEVVESKKSFDINRAKKLNARIKILRMEKALEGLDNCIHMNDPDTPLTHHFADGLYGREIFIPKGYCLTTGIHATEHIAIISKGKCTVVSEDGIVDLEAPHTMVTKIGTKRAIYVHEDLVWTTVHLNPDNENDIDKLVSMISFKNFKEYLDFDSLQAQVGCDK